MERFLTLVFLGILFGQVFLVPGILFLAGWLTGKRALRRVSCAVLVGSLFWLGISYIYPPVICPQTMIMERREAVRIIQPVARGKGTLPLMIPIFVEVTEEREDFLRWRTYYIPFGQTEHIWTGSEGAYEMTEPLAGW